ncbi:MAG: chromate resistance protein ChrB domain-containing protein [Gemmatimonadales bacterium]
MIPQQAPAAAPRPRADSPAARWLLLIHQIPPKPDYFRVKVRRRLQRLGAVALKNSVYVLPKTDAALEDFQWLSREIVADGGEATVCEAAFIQGITNDELVALFHAEREAEYQEIAAAAQGLRSAPEPPADVEVARLRRRLDDVAAVDFFDAPARAAAEAAIAALQAGPERAEPATGSEVGRGRTWVTRRGVHVDRIASAWLIRRFIDPAAAFKFVEPKGYRPEPGELRFDMFEAEFTHEAERCTFETLLARLGPPDRALRAIGEMVHDIDCKDERYGREETPGFAALVRGITLASDDDADRLERGAPILDHLYTHFQKSRG